MREVEARRFAVPLARLEALCALAGPLAEPSRLAYAPSPSRSLESNGPEVTTRVPDSPEREFAGRAVEAARGYYQEQFPTTKEVAMTKPDNECVVELTTGPRKGETGRVITRETPDPGQYWVQLSDGPELIWESDFRVTDGKL